MKHEPDRFGTCTRCGEAMVSPLDECLPTTPTGGLPDLERLHKENLAMGQTLSGDMIAELREVQASSERLMHAKIDAERAMMAEREQYAREAEERSAWDMFAAHAFGSLADLRRLVVRRRVAARFADMMLEERRKRFSLPKEKDDAQAVR